MIDLPDATNSSDDITVTMSSDSPVIPSVKTSSYPVREGNSVRPLIDGEPAFRRICEAIEGARHRVWATIAFLWADFEMPEGRGSAFNVLNRAAARGVDVRLIFWRPGAEAERWRRNTFWGSADHLRQLEAGGYLFKIRWDQAAPGFCQHQKSWLIDAGSDHVTAFVGGINLNPNSMVSPGHAGNHRGGEAQNHDAYVELTGPSVVDVHHNFAQRWNEASEHRLAGGRWGLGSETDLTLPTTLPAKTGQSVVQIQRTVHRGRYTDGRPPPNGTAFDISAGERSNFDQYCAAIAAARRSIYLEHHSVEEPMIIEKLRQALQRGVDVVLLLPVDPQRRAFSDLCAALRVFENFTLAGLAGLNANGRRKPVYVHSKLMLVDGTWATVGSCNLHAASLFGNAEMNVAIWDSEAVRVLRSALFQEHLDQDTSQMDDCAAHRLFRKIALINRSRFDAVDPAWQGLAFSQFPPINAERIV